MTAAGQERRRRPALPAADRERLVLDTAAELFYERGVRAVGMDELIAAAGLSKMSVYRLFPTKDALVAAWLQRLRTTILAEIDDQVAQLADRPDLALAAILDAVEADLARPGFRGCPFGNAAVDFDADDHPARVLARTYRADLRERLRSLAVRTTGDQTAGQVLGDRLAVLVDGAYLSAAHLGPQGPAAAALALARELVAAAGGVQVVEVLPSDPEARRAMERYFRELDERFVGGFDVAAALAAADADLSPPDGLFLLARDAATGAVLGCVGLHHLDAHRTEVKRMWVDPAARGRGLAGRLLARCEHEALATGRTTAVLDTNGVLAEALALYPRHGYREIPRYNDNPYAQHWFAKDLRAGGVSGRSR